VCVIVEVDLVLESTFAESRAKHPARTRVWCDVDFEEFLMNCFESVQVHSIMAVSSSQSNPFAASSPSLPESAPRPFNNEISSVFSTSLADSW